MVKQGELGTTDTLLGGNATYKVPYVITSIRFRSPSSSVLTVSRYSRKDNRTDIVYQYTLAAGDTVIDSSSYTLEPGDFLYARGSVSGITYILTTP